MFCTATDFLGHYVEQKIQKGRNIFDGYPISSSHCIATISTLIIGSILSMAAPLSELQNFEIGGQQ